MTWPEGSIVRPKFVGAGCRGGKVRCVVCGRKGYIGGSWQDSCIAGHPYRCRCSEDFVRCFSTLMGLSTHRRWAHRPSVS